MKKYLMIIVQLLLSVQSAVNAADGLTATTRNAIAQSGVTLSNNWQCSRSGIGPNCTEEQRSALRIIQDFVTGKWEQARTNLREFFAEHKHALEITGGVLSTILMVAAVLGVAHVGAQMDIEAFKSTVSSTNKEALSKNEWVTLMNTIRFLRMGRINQFGPRVELVEQSDILEKLGKETTTFNGKTFAQLKEEAYGRERKAIEEKAQRRQAAKGVSAS